MATPAYAAAMQSLTRRLSRYLFAFFAGSLLIGCVAPPEATQKIKQASLVKASQNGMDVRKLQGFVNDRSAVILSGVDIEAVERVSAEMVAVRLDADDGERVEVSFGLCAAVTADGYYVTAAHTVQENHRDGDRIWLVRNVDSQPFVRARVVWSDANADLAIVKGGIHTEFFRQASQLPAVGNSVFCHGKDAWPSAGEVKRILFDSRRKTYTIEHDGPLKRSGSKPGKYACPIIMASSSCNNARKGATSSFSNSSLVRSITGNS